MRIIAKKTLRKFWERHPDAKGPLLAWYGEVEREDWARPADVKAKYGTASIVDSERVVFNIKGNDYRLVVRINYAYRIRLRAFRRFACRLRQRGRGGGVIWRTSSRSGTSATTTPPSPASTTS